MLGSTLLTYFHFLLAMAASSYSLAMSSFTTDSTGRWHELNDLGTTGADGSSRQFGDSIASALPAKAQVQSEVSTNTDDPFLDRPVHVPRGGRHDSQHESSDHAYTVWTWEILSVIFSILCMAVIVGVLVVYHGRPVPTLPLGLTLNAVISLLATISKAAMLVSVASCISQLKWQWFRRPQKLTYFDILDEASRGPWGALRLLWRIRKLSLVGLGALITIVAIGIDPFMQQIISYPTKSIETGSSSSNRAQMYDTGSNLRDIGGGVYTGPEFGMKSAIYNGIFNQSNSAHSTSSCSTGNCTFPLFDSLAFCSKCRNVTDSTILSQHTSGRNLGFFRPGTTIANYTYSLPGNYTIMVTGFFEGDPANPKDLLYGPVLISNFGMPESMSRSQLGIPNPISSLAVLQFPQIEQEGYGGDYLKQTPQAWQCALYFCLQTYNITVLNSVPKVDIVSSWNSDTGTPLPQINQFPYDYIDTNDTTFTRPADSLVKGGNDNFLIPGGTIAAMATYLNYTMSGSQLMQLSETNDQDRWPNDVMQALNSTVDIAGLMTGLASSITTFIRQSDNRGDSPDTITTGVALKLETYMHVRWAWFALPVMILLLSILFLITTMILASKQRIPVWKSSSLAILFHGWVSESMNPTQSSSQDGLIVGRISEMKDVAETMEATLRRGGNGEWHLDVLDQYESK